MAHATISAPAGARSGNRRVKLTATTLAWTGIVVLAVGFVAKYVLFYYRHYDAASLDPYWPRRGWLFLHINGGTLALLTGPWQFWTGLRQRNLAIHRWTGRLFLVGVAMGIVGAVGLSVTSTYGWALVNGIRGLALAWLVTTGMAYYTIRKGLVSLHKVVDDPRLRGYVRVCDLPALERLWPDFAAAAGKRPRYHYRLGLLGCASGDHRDGLSS